MNHKIPNGHTRSGWTDAELFELSQSHAGGCSDRTIAQILGRTVAAVSSMRGRMGLSSHGRQVVSAGGEMRSSLGDVAALIVRARKSAGMTQDALAIRAGVSASVVRRIESTSNVTIATLLRVMVALEIDAVCSVRMSP